MDPSSLAFARADARLQLCCLVWIGPVAGAARGQTVYLFSVLIVLSVRGHAKLISHLGEQGQARRPVDPDWHRRQPTGLVYLSRSAPLRNARSLIWTPFESSASTFGGVAPFSIVSHPGQLARQI